MRAVLYRMRVWGRARRWAALGLAVVVALGGAGVLALAAGATRTASAPDRYSRWRGDLADAAIQQESGPPALAELEALGSTRQVELATFVFGQVASADGDAPADELVFAGDQAPMGTRLVAGHLPDPAHPEQFVATQPLARELGAALGDRFTLRTLTQAQADANGFLEQGQATSRPAVLVGEIDGPSDLNDGYEVALFPRTLLDQGDIGVSATVGAVGLSPGATLADLQAEVAALPDGARFSVTPDELIGHEVRSAVTTQARAILIVTAIVLLTAVVVLGQLLGRQLAMGEDERTALKAAGYSRRQLVLDPIARAAVPVVAGAVGAGVLAYLASGLFPVGFVTRVEPHPGRRVDPLVHGAGALALAVVLLTWVAVTLAASTRARPPAPRSTVTERLAGSVPLLQVSTALRFAFAPSRPRARAVTTQLVGLGFLVVLLVGALTFGANFERMVQRPDAYGVSFDAALGEGADQIPPDELAAVEGDPVVGAVTLFGTSTVTAGTRSTNLVGMESRRGDLRPTLLSGRLPVGADEAALGPVLARQLHVAAGDELALRAGSRHRTVEVTGTVLVPPVNGADVLGQSVLVDGEGFRALVPSVQMTVLAFDLRPGTPRSELERIVSAAGADGGELSPPAAIVNLHRVRSVPYLVAAAVGLLTVLDLTHLTIVAVRRRRRDLAVLRALGTTPRWLAGTVHWQTTLAVLVVLAVSMPLGVAAGRALYQRFMTDLGAHTTVVVPLGPLAVTAVAAVVLANVVAARPARRAGRVPTAMVLAASG